MSSHVTFWRTPPSPSGDDVIYEHPLKSNLYKGRRTRRAEEGGKEVFCITNSHALTAVSYHHGGSSPPTQRLLYMRRDPTMLICKFPFAKQRRSRSTNTQQWVIAQLCFFTPMTGLGFKRFQQFQILIRCNLGSLAELLSAQSHQLQCIG